MVLESREAILPLAPQLEAFAASCGQAGALHWLPYFLDAGVLRMRDPRLVLLLRSGVRSSWDLQASDMQGVALFFEYRVLGVRSRIVATADAVGFSSVVAPRGKRAHVAAVATRVLQERGAVMALSTYESEGEPEVRGGLANWPGVSWAWRQREVGRLLNFASTFEETLAGLGKSTRFNLRYYRRRLSKEVGCEYVPDAVPFLKDEELQAINARSLNPVEPEEFKRRVSSARELPGSYLCGLRSADGRWLSLIGGWRQDGTTVLYWQMNTSGLEKYSIGTAMRSFYLQDEIERGAKRLLIYGGTSHTMRHAFLQEPVADLAVCRKGVRGLALRQVIRTIGTFQNRFGKPNFVIDTLRDRELGWTVSKAGGSSKASVIKSARGQEIA